MVIARFPPPASRALSGRYSQHSGNEASQTWISWSIASMFWALEILLGDSSMVLLVVSVQHTLARDMTEYCTVNVWPIQMQSFTFEMHRSASSRCVSRLCSSENKPGRAVSSLGKARISKSLSLSIGRLKSPLILIGRLIPREMRRSRMKQDHQIRLHRLGL